MTDIQAKCNITGCECKEDIKLVQFRGPGINIFYDDPVQVCVIHRRNMRGQWAYAKRRVESLKGNGLD